MRARDRPTRVRSPAIGTGYPSESVERAARGTPASVIHISSMQAERGSSAKASRPRVGPAKRIKQSSQLMIAVTTWDTSDDALE